MASGTLPTVLFVDDDTHLLRSMERLFGMQYRVAVAASGQEGLDELKSNGPFDVVVSDMQMPRMDGVTFLHEAKDLYPDSTYIMLTGNQDQPTATRAINEGEVFRFLVKPCDAPDLEDAINLGVRRHRSTRHEKELLRETFLGALKLFSTVISVTQPGAADSGSSVEHRVQVLQDAIGIDEHWEYKIAGYVSPVGVALLDEEDRNLVEWSCHQSQQVRNAMLCATEITTSLVRTIPRLEVVAKISALRDEADGEICSTHPRRPAAVVHVGATLLRAAVHWHYLAQQGLAPKELSKEIKALMPKLPARALEAVEKQTQEPENKECLSLTRSELRRGMVLGTSLTSPEGALLVRQGYRLTDECIARLDEYQLAGSILVTRRTALA